MNYLTLCNAKLTKRIEEINYSNEMLEHGISELEALYLRMESGAAILELGSFHQADANVSLLNRRNHSLAYAINEALIEVETTLKHQMEIGADLDKEIIHEFTVVLRESIRIFHEYRVIEEGYHNTKQEEDVLKAKASCYPLTATKKETQTRGLPIIQQLQRLIRSFCICGSRQMFHH